MKLTVRKDQLQTRKRIIQKGLPDESAIVEKVERIAAAVIELIDQAKEKGTGQLYQ